MPLREYQEQAVAFGHEAGDRWINADAAGSGKTPTTLRWLSEVASDRPALVVAPDAVTGQWLAQTAEWTQMEPVKLTGPPAERKQALQGLGAGSLAVTNYDLLRRDHEALQKVAWGAVALDEAHRLKGRTNQTGLAAQALRSDGLVTLTGTPLLNSADELWMLLHLARPKLYTSFWRWARQHFYVEMTDHHGKAPQPVPEIVGMRPGHEELIQAEAAEIMLWREIDDLLPDLPPVNTQFVEVDLTPAERALYDSIKRKGWGRHGDDVVTTKNAIGKLLRLRQITSAWSSLVDESLGSKAEAAVDMIEGSTEQVVILTAFQNTADEITGSLRSAVAYTGKTTKRGRHDAVEAFKRGDAQCIVGTIAAMGEGVDGLQVAHRMVRVDRDWTPARNDQVIGRIRRSGQLADSLLVVDVVARDTVDQYVAEALARKTSVIDAVRL